MNSHSPCNHFISVTSTGDMSSVLLGDAHGVSVVDFAPFLDGSAKRDVANAILDSFKRIGFVYLVNHGIPTEKVQDMFSWVCLRILFPCIRAHGAVSYCLVETLLCAPDGKQAARAASPFWRTSPRYVRNPCMPKWTPDWPADQVTLHQVGRKYLTTYSTIRSSRPDAQRLKM